MRNLLKVFRKPEPAKVPAKDNDGRLPGEFASRYGWGVWFQVVLELLVLLVALYGALYVVCISIWKGYAPVWRLEEFIQQSQPWPAVFCAGVAGGCLFALKFLYHAVAKQEWNQDRVLWRFIVPVNSGTLALFSGFGISAGVIPFIDQQLFENVYIALFFGFFIGHFSDNFLAALQRLAHEWFGTVDRTEKH